MSFIKRAQEAAKTAAEQAQHAAEQARTRAGEAAEQARTRAGEAAVEARARAGDAADQAQHAAGQARTLAGEAAASAGRQAHDPATQERLGKQARDAMGKARRGITTVVERIDPNTLADLVIKATALQEMTNKALRTKGSPYRISEISIEASIPPGIAFSIGRIDDPEELVSGETVSSAALIEAMTDTGEAVISLDGTTLDHASLDAAGAAAAIDPTDGAEPLSDR